MRLVKLALAAAIAPAAMFAALPARAAPEIYSYAGNNFTSVFAAGYTTSDKITGTITLSSALPDSLSTLTDETALVTSYSFSDGVNTFASPCCNTGNQTIFDFTTDSSGNITSWVVTLETDDNHTGDLTTQGGAVSLDQSLVGGVLGGANNDSPGVWTLESSMTAVPEPATWMMLVLGFAVLGQRLRSARKPLDGAILA